MSSRVIGSLGRGRHLSISRVIIEEVNDLEQQPETKVEKPSRIETRCEPERARRKTSTVKKSVGFFKGLWIHLLKLLGVRR